ncbi:MAG: carboxypeptidase-like regulatory domain-containing protein [Paludibacter sp.]|nr:carboxypeptidase-like regulatory domain-containing protein [Paludibacter sp.]
MKTISKNQFKRMLVLTCVAIFSFMLYAENSGSVMGRVVDNNNQPVECATVILKSSNTDKFVTGNVSNSKGEFVIENVDQGEYKLTVSLIGYAKFETEKIVVNPKQNCVVVENVMLNEVPEKSVVVVAKKNYDQNLLSAQ